MEKCKICEHETNSVFGIDFKHTFICEVCANQVAMQQVRDLIQRADHEYGGVKCLEIFRQEEK